MIIWLLVQRVLAETCPLYTCEVLDTRVCVEYTTSTNYTINKEPCPSSFYCSYEDFADWQITAVKGDQLLCTTEDTGTLTIDDPKDSDYLCGAREEDRDLEYGSYPKLCDDKSDCKLDDGTYNTCSCGLDGSAYCEPDINSDAFDDYWDECWEDNYGRIESFKHWAFWKLKSTYFVPYTSAYSCAHNLLSEFIQIDDYDYVGDWANAVAWSGFILLSFS
mmetsp:Transcript_3046/g.6307  ORF Transcript_3046/g.6307 Transcript_3046/m.6307 type:complete len:219 (+) Transcript_3046:256-912(+)|eukprot:CAMPEP_0204910762 /NCGR_PEP_ID=MMETSP1397-20131031/9221_1 /ASSEMBLY_ACC=CAM_ASM_000891 /TAXON_ID=49980 /ORGANISM="Climacostomum Climacostomum virens, Strain Stock W-24" /LENGTH=218 /DNA_ID=CAMNT_0052081033 /DNA_START=145 /DNA_END=801 /DNA_ORIENTATION=-